jgi:hypothetical protein
MTPKILHKKKDLTGCSIQRVNVDFVSGWPKNKLHELVYGKRQYIWFASDDWKAKK